MYLRVSDLADVLVPFASRWHPVAVAWGVIGIWLLFAIEISSLAMRFLPRRVWHAIHLSSFVLFVSATMHAVASGPDTRKQTFELVLSAVLAVVTLLTMVRVARSKQKGSPRPRTRPPSAAPELVDAGTT